MSDYDDTDEDDGNASEASETSVDSSDIESMLRKVRRRKQASIGTSACIHSSGGGGGDRGVVYANDCDDAKKYRKDASKHFFPYRSGRKRKNSNSYNNKRIDHGENLDEKLALLEKEQALAKRRRENRWKKQYPQNNDNNSDSDDSDIEHNRENNNPMQMHAVKQHNNTASMVSQCTVSEGDERRLSEKVIELGDSSDDDDDDDYDDVKEISEDTEQARANAVNSSLLKELAKAAACLQQPADVSTGLNVTEWSRAASKMSLCVDMKPPSQSQIQLTIKAVLVSPKSSSNDPPTAKTVALSMSLTDPMSSAITQLLKSLGLSPQAGVVKLTSSQQQVLYPKHTADSYGLNSGDSIHAKVHLLHHSSISAAGSAASGGAQPPPRRLGHALTLLFRQPCGKTLTIATFMNEDFHAISAKLVQPNDDASKRWRLRFDGEYIDNLSQTPAAWDMEDQFLIDLVPKN